MPRAALAICLAAALAAGCGGGDKPKKPLPPASASIRLSSTAFADGGAIPRRYSCDGEEVSPPLRWSGVPGGTRELALIVEDRDANFVHWSLLAIPASTTSIAEGRVPHGAVQTANSFGDRRWGGPCPPKGKGAHHYVFALYALGKPLGLGKGASIDDVQSKVGAAATARGILTGLYER